MPVALVASTTSQLIQVFQIDAFAERPFAGNPAAVCLLDHSYKAEWMQQVASEMNLSETAFVRARADGSGFDLRWFTPTVEVDLCGHATLASAEALWRSGRLDAKSIARFMTRSGWLTAERHEDWIELDFPVRALEECPPPQGLLEALAVRPVWLGRHRDIYFVELESAAAVREVTPDFSRLREVEAHGVIITAVSDDDRFDFISRFFAPAAGVNEDPVTGSAHCALAPFWAARFGRPELVGFQASRRGGQVRVRLLGDRVRIAGKAVTVFEGHLTADAINPGIQS